MAKYLVLIYGDEREWEAMSEQAREDCMAAHRHGLGTLWRDPAAPQVSVTAASAPEGSAAKPGVLTFTASVPSALTSPLPLTVVDRDGKERASVTIAAGAKAATFTVSEPGDAVPAPDRVVTYGLTSSAPALLPAVVVGTLTNDDGTGPALAVAASDPLPAAAGEALPAQIDWRNDGVGAAKDAVLSGTFSALAPVARVTSSTGTCTVGAPNGTGAVAWSCALGTLSPGTAGSVILEWAATRPGTVTGAVTLAASGTPTASATLGPLAVTGRACTVTGVIGKDTIAGTDGADVLCGPMRLAGPRDDVFAPGAGDDVIVGEGILDYSRSPKRIADSRTAQGMQIKGWGADLLVPAGSTILRSGLIGSPKNDNLVLPWASVVGGAGNDTVVLDPADIGRRTLDGGPGTDTIKIKSGPGQTPAVSLSGPGTQGFEKLIDGPASSLLSGDGGANVIRGGRGDDRINVSDGVSGNDTVDGEDGDDTCTADVGDRVTCETVTWVPVG